MKDSSSLTSECIAGLCKLMGNLDLLYAGSKMTITATCNTTIGTVDSTVAIWNILGELRDKYAIPTQTCVLSHVSTQMAALRTGAKADLCFQSIAGSQAALASFGVTTELLEEANALFRDDQAKANDAMFSEVSEDTLRALGVFSVQTQCRDKYEMLTRPDYGRILPPDWCAFSIFPARRRQFFWTEWTQPLLTSLPGARFDSPPWICTPINTSGAVHSPDSAPLPRMNCFLDASGDLRAKSRPQPKQLPGLIQFKSGNSYLNVY